MNWELLAITSGIFLTIAKISDVLLIYQNKKFHDKVINFWIFLSEAATIDLLIRNIKFSLKIVQLVYNEKSKKVIKRIISTIFILIIPLYTFFITYVLNHSRSDDVSLLFKIIAFLLIISGGIILPILISLIVTHSFLERAQDSKKVIIISLLLMADIVIAACIFLFEIIYFSMLTGYFGVVYGILFGAISLIPTIIHFIINTLILSLMIVSIPILFFSERVFYIAAQKLNNNIITIIVGSYLLILSLASYSFTLFITLVK